jgi:hypothetical protein
MSDGCVLHPADSRLAISGRPPVALSREELTSAVHDNLKHLGLETGCAADEPTHEVCVRSEDLSPNVADPALLQAGVFQSYLERVS